jgi:hypothetical protein
MFPCSCSLFFEYLFSKWCWSFLNVQFTISLSPQDMLIKSRRQFNSKIVREVNIVPSSSMGASASLGPMKEAFKDKFGLITHKAKPSTKILLTNWLGSL